MTAFVAIGLSAVVVALRGGEAVVLTARLPVAGRGAPHALPGLPSGPFDPAEDRTFERALRTFVTAQTGFELGFVEQLYTFGDKGRGAPLADLGARRAEGERVVSVGYLALTPAAVEVEAPGAAWSPWTRFFPWEDWRRGRPEAIDAVIVPALEGWAACAPDAGARAQRRARAHLLFAQGGGRWDEERVLERYELLYEAGLAVEAARDRARMPLDPADPDRGPAAPPPLGGDGEQRTDPGRFDPAWGQPMISDHRRILATGLGRLRGKLKYRPVIFDLMGPEFTLSALQRAVEAITGVLLHKQNFRRGLERTELTEGLGRVDADTGGRPAELFRFRRERLAARPATGLPLPGLREG